jgi:hypothetical protein
MRKFFRCVLFKVTVRAEYELCVPVPINVCTASWQSYVARSIQANQMGSVDIHGHNIGTKLISAQNIRHNNEPARILA